MRIKDALVPIAIHTGVNNNQIDRQNFETASGSKIIENINGSSAEELSGDTSKYEKSLGFEIQGFRVAEDTTRWSSVAVARSNVNINSKRVNNNNNINNNINNNNNNINNNKNNKNNNNNNINNNLNVSRLSLSSSADSLSDYEAHEYSVGSDCSDISEEGIIPGHCRGIINPNYPGFQHLASSFLSIFADEDQPDSNLSSKIIENNSINTEEKDNNNEDIKNLENVNRLDDSKGQNKFFYEKSKLNIQAVSTFYEGIVSSSEKCLNYVKSIKDSNIETVIETPCDSNEDINDYLQPWSHSQPIEFEVAELQSSSIELPQFPQVEKLPTDSGKTSDLSSEPEETTIERMDLIAETTKPPPKSSDDKKSVEIDSENIVKEEQSSYTKIEEIDLLSSIGRDIGVDLEKYVQSVPDVVAMETIDHVHSNNSSLSGLVKETIINDDTNKFIDDVTKIDSTSSINIDCRKNEKMARNQARRRQQSHSNQRRTDNNNKRRSDNYDKISSGSFDVYNIETAMPKIDLDVIESHLRAAREEERRRRNDREEIRRRLAMGPDADDVRSERGKKPSLQSRLQSGMNLQICFMNETPSDTESPNSENDSSPDAKKPSPRSIIQQSNIATNRPQILNLPSLRLDKNLHDGPIDEADFFSRQARLQTEARMALAQAKEMAHMQMEVERQRLTQSPITEMVRSSLEKVGVQLGEDRRRLSRVLLTELNVAQLQVVANDLHARIAVLNEALVEGLLRRDDLHMEQDSMLVDVEDLTRYFGAKKDSYKKRQAIKDMSTTIVKHRHLAQKKIAFIKTHLATHSLVNFVRK